ncbi:hypothetical protein G5V65_02305 [Rhodobacter sp. HX-7-19]|uniref:DUF4065 domain-containing protein n=1 Tax=Paragemmobacter kunshanensis TaxID=2583234 RepID=A0A6M1TWV9_9RHOB|nr:hypothetical protein [Rhodobacter kunshanensis]NGQ89714.1 hypothetical protein [Rhodobacter kunshanensis]
MASRAQDVAIYLSHHFHHAWEGFGFFDLQRLLYLAQGWHLASGRGVLFSESIGAHKAAPLTYSVKGLLPMEEMLPHPDLSPQDEEFLDSFCTTYGVADRGAVRRQVDREDGAWRLTQLIGGEGATVHPQLMEATFRLMLLDHAESGRQLRKSQIISQKQRFAGGNVVAFRGR